MKMVVVSERPLPFHRYEDGFNRSQVSARRRGCRLSCEKLLKPSEGTLTLQEYYKRLATLSSDSQRT